MSSNRIIRTYHKNTISTTKEMGDILAEDFAILDVVDANTGCVVGFITSTWFRNERYHRTVHDQLIWVCPFIRNHNF